MTYAELETTLLQKERAIELAYERGLYEDELAMRDHLDRVRAQYACDVQWLNRAAA